MNDDFTPYAASEPLGRLLAQWQYDQMTEEERQAKAEEMRKAFAQVAEALRPIGETLVAAFASIAQSVANSPLIQQWLAAQQSNVPAYPLITTTRIAAHQPRTKSRR